MSKVLLVSDNPTSLAMLQGLFEAHDEFLLCGQAQSGSEAISKATQIKPGLIILDFGDSFTEGLQTAKELREELPDAQLFFAHRRLQLLCGKGGRAVRNRCGLCSR